MDSRCDRRMTAWVTLWMLSVCSAANAGLTHPAPVLAADSAYRVVHLRADRANGTGPYATNQVGSPWVDLAGTPQNGALFSFQGTLSGGWSGNGSVASPYRLEYGNEDFGQNSYVAIPAGSIPELQSIGPVTAMVWFKTGFDGALDRYDYLLEWVEPPGVPYDPATEGLGMSIVVQNGKLQVYANPWVVLDSLAGNSWHHVAVTKDSADLRIYVDGAPRFSGTVAHQGRQQSPLVIGSSIFRIFEGYPPEAAAADFFNGSIAQVDVWKGALSDSAVRAEFRADSGLYLPRPAEPDAEPVVRLRADRADGSGPYSIPGAGSPWKDLEGASSDATLSGLSGAPGSGWQGNGTMGSPYRLEFDGVDDIAVILAGSVIELMSAGAHASEVWFRPGPTEDRDAYVLEWLQGFGSSQGMSIETKNGDLRVYLGWTLGWTTVAAVTPGTWYHVVVVKRPGEVAVLVNGARVFDSPITDFGAAITQIVIGCSTWRGAGNYGDFYAGALGEVTLWRGAPTDSQVTLAYYTGASRFHETTAVRERPSGLSLRGALSNPVRGGLDVRFALPDARHATLELLDVTGRRVRAREVGALGAGSHVVRLGDARALAAGVYWIRLRREGVVLTAKAVVLR